MDFARLRQIHNQPNIPITQEELICFLALTKSAAWDIPSALGTLCTHLDMDYFPMHRHHLFPEADPYWVTLDPHFKKIHGLDLKDDLIRWNFDT